MLVKRTCLVASLAILIVSLSPAVQQSNAAGGAKTSVIGGNPAPGPTFNYVVGILRNGRMWCSGSVISPHHILTAAHCAVGVPVSQLLVVANTPNVKRKTMGEVLNVESAVLHPDYGAAPLHDLAVLTLSGSTSAAVIGLPTPEEDAVWTRPGRSLRVVGFGDQRPFLFQKPKFGSRQSALVRVRRACKRVYDSLFTNESMICATGSRLRGALGVRRAICSGDSGGPIVAKTSSGPKVVGVTSVGLGVFFYRCGVAPDLFARVSHDLAFVRAMSDQGPPFSRFAGYAPGGKLKIAKRFAFRFACSIECSLRATSRLVLPGPDLGPVTSFGTFQPGQQAEVYFLPNRAAREAMIRSRGLAVLKSRIEATDLSTGTVEVHTRDFGFRVTRPVRGIANRAGGASRTLRASVVAKN